MASVKKLVTVGAAMAVTMAFLLPEVSAQTKPPTAWVPANSGNYTVSSANPMRQIKYVVIHDIEGSAAGAISWFQNPNAHASAHYVIGYDGAITQMVQDKDIAWHAGNWTYNSKSLGIEHAGYASQNNYTESEYVKSAQLVRWMCLTYAVPMVYVAKTGASGILAHSDVPDPNNPGQYGGAGHHHDPGPYWNWTHFMSLVTNGGSTPPPPPPYTTKAKKVNTGTLNVRSGPGTSYSIKGTVSSGQIYIAPATQNGWFKIWYDGSFGWCSGSYVTTQTGVTAVKCNVSTLNVRSGPSTGYAIVGSMSNGQQYARISISGDWRKIWFKNAGRWCYGPYTVNVNY